MTHDLPKIKLPDGRTIDQPHPEWCDHHLLWRRLLDSFEGGEAYRNAVYGTDARGYPVRNLVRHKREYPAPLDGDALGYTGRPAGSDPNTQATDDDYELRRARTPVPAWVSETVEAHLSKIYSVEIDRAGPEALAAWWQDVDGRGTAMDAWMADTIAPLLLVLGQLDLVFDHPPAPEDEEVRTRADELRLRLGGCVASYILPENLVWWTLDRQGRYTECLVREVEDCGEVEWKYWTATFWQQYDSNGQPDGDPVPHPFGRVPILRLFDRKRPRTTHTGLPRYETIADLQREYYNRDSELILSDTTQAHPLLQGPEDYVQPDGTIPIGPSWLLPKKKTMTGAQQFYEGFDVIQFPKDGAVSLRANKADLRDAADRAACLTKPAGAAGTTASTVAQSGLSKRLDQSAGNDLLAKIAGMLGSNEQAIAELVLTVVGNGTVSPADLAAVKVTYPRQFDLWDVQELGLAIAEFQANLQAAGNAPETEGRLLKLSARRLLLGLADAEYAAIDAEIDAYLAQKTEERQQRRESQVPAGTGEPGTPANAVSANVAPGGEGSGIKTSMTYSNTGMT